MPISEQLLTYIEALERELGPQFNRISRVAVHNQLKVLEAFQNARIGTHHFHPANGYGYHDYGRDGLETVFAEIFKTEAALVRQQMVSGTHAIGCALFGNLRPTEELVIASGSPYETLISVLGLEMVAGGQAAEGTSTTGGFKVKIVPLTANGSLDLAAIGAALSEKTKIVAFQRSCGYSERHSYSIQELEAAFAVVKTVKPGAIIFVDNCYGEFVEEKEPPEVGADLIAGSLIKNPGGCLAPCGGYIAGKKELVDAAAERLYVPKIGGAIGPSLLELRPFFQGLFEAPHRVSDMVKGAILAAKLFGGAGFKVAPAAEEARTDIIQKIYFNSSVELIEFCRAIQRFSPVESDVSPEPAPMPGYHHPVVMGGGTFISGSTSEFSADAPITPPYTAFLQGGLSYTQIKVSLACIYHQAGLYIPPARVSQN
jgi:cystathionine beta-lyase family protein involved in aluminum resistance